MSRRHPARTGVYGFFDKETAGRLIGWPPLPFKEASNMARALRAKGRRIYIRKVRAS